MANEDTNHCPICGREAGLTIGATLLVRCAHCGEYEMNRLLQRTTFRGENSDPELKELAPYLAAYIRQANLRREEVILTADNWKDRALAHKDIPVSKKVMKLLELAAERAKPGTSIEFNQQLDPPLVDAVSRAELLLLLGHLVEIEYLHRVGDAHYYVKLKGWEQLESAAVGGIAGRCFVAMSFDQSLNTAYDEGISPAVKEDCRMEPRRVDRVHHNENISDKIIAEIRTCQFTVADFTLQRQAVYFEAGFAMGLGRPVIWTCREDDFANVHFDTKQYNHIRWKTPQDFRIQLTDRIRATIPGASGV